MIRRFLVPMMMLCSAAAVAQQTRIASDFEIEQMTRQVARSRDFLSQISARLNLGDLRASRNELSAAADEYRRAREIAAQERHRARAESKLSRYATATAYAGLAEAKLGRRREAFALLEEAARYASDDAETWNIYSSAMRVARLPKKAVAAARTAVAISEGRTAETSAPLSSRLDLAVHRYALASALIESGGVPEAERLLAQIVDALAAREFDSLQREIARAESFEIYSSARGEAAAYLSVLNRAQLRLAALHEQRGDTAGARRIYERVLASRSDDPAALAALARLARSPEEKERLFADAFDANPFSMNLVREYEKHLRSSAAARQHSDGRTTAGAQMRRALQQMARGENRAARATLESLLRTYPKNRTIESLLARKPDVTPALPTKEQAKRPLSAADLRPVVALLAGGKMTPEQRAALDELAFISDATFDASAHAPAAGQTIFESGAIGDVAIRFAEPVAFSGSFPAGRPLRLTYRILGITAHRGADALLLEPLRLEALP